MAQGVAQGVTDLIDSSNMLPVVAFQESIVQQVPLEVAAVELVGLLADSPQMEPQMEPQITICQPIFNHHLPPC